MTGEMSSQNAIVRAAACSVVRQAAAVSSRRSAGGEATMWRAVTAWVANAMVLPISNRASKALKAPNWAGDRVRAATRVCA